MTAVLPPRIVHVVTTTDAGTVSDVTRLALAQVQAHHRCAEILVAGPDPEATRLSSLAFDPRVRVRTCHTDLDLEVPALRLAAEQIRTLVSPTGSWAGIILHAHDAFSVVASRWSGAPKVVASMHATHASPWKIPDLTDVLAYRSSDWVIVALPHVGQELAALFSPASVIEVAGLDPLDHAEALWPAYGQFGRDFDLRAWTAPEGPVRVHLGCGGRRRDGWLNVDARADARPDLVATAQSLPMLADESVDVIEACHLYEHLPAHEARAALSEWARVLKPGGELFLELPNFDACVRLLGQHADIHGDDLAMMGIYGWARGVEMQGDSMAHHWGWTPSTLANALRAAGFHEVTDVPPTQTWRPTVALGMDFRLRAVKPALLHAR